MCPTVNPPLMSASKPSFLGHRQRLKQRWIAVGIDGFNDRELLELLLSFALPRKDTREIALTLLQTYGDLATALSQSAKRLQVHPGLGEHSAILLSLAGQLQRRPRTSLRGVVVRSPAEVQDYLLAELGGCAEEKIYILLLDQSNRVLDAVQLEHGIENRANIYLKKAVRLAFDRHATGVICVHNHPSGQAHFSNADIEMTAKLKSALKPLEIRLLDHFLVAGDQVISMSEQGLYSPD